MPKLIPPLKKDSENRLETVSMLEAGTAVIGDVNRVATVGRIEHLGSIANTSFNQGSVSDPIRQIYGYDYIDAARFVRVDTAGRLEVREPPPTGRKGGKKTVTTHGYEVRLVGSSTPAVYVNIKALHANTGEIYVGDSTVDSTHGYILLKDEWIAFPVDDVYDVYIDSSVSGEGVSFLYVSN